MKIKNAPTEVDAYKTQTPIVAKQVYIGVQFYNAHILEFALLPNLNMNAVGTGYTFPF